MTECLIQPLLNVVLQLHDFVVGGAVVLPDEGQPQGENEVEQGGRVMLEALEKSTFLAGVPDHLAIALGQTFVAQRVATTRT